MRRASDPPQESGSAPSSAEYMPNVEFSNAEIDAIKAVQWPSLHYTIQDPPSSFTRFIRYRINDRYAR
jgi:hypothetical protein